MSREKEASRPSTDAVFQTWLSAGSCASPAPEKRWPHCRARGRMIAAPSAPSSRPAPARMRRGEGEQILGRTSSRIMLMTRRSAGAFSTRESDDMTRDADFKRLVRARMTETDESYLQARTAMTQRPTPAHLQAVPATPKPAPDGAESVIVSLARSRSVQQFFDGGRLRSIPVKRTKRMAVLLVLVALFEPGRTYTEAEVSQILHEVDDDHAYLRRELVNAGYLTRDAGVYTLASAPPARDARWAQEYPSDEGEVFAALWRRSVRG